MAFLGLTVGTVAIVATVGCAPAAAPPATAPGAAPAAPAPAPAAPQEVTVGIPNRSFGWLPLLLAEKKGFFQEERIQLTLPETACAAQVAALERGDLKLSGCVSPIVKAAAEHGLRFKAIVFAYNKLTFVLVSSPSVGSVSELRGKLVGISGYGTDSHNAAKVALAKYGLEPDRDDTFLQVGAGPQVLAALETGAVQAGMLNTDGAARILPHGFKALMSAQELGELLAIPFSGFALTEDTLQKDRELMKRWLKAYTRGLLLMADRPDEAALLGVEELNMEPDQARDAVALSLPAMAKPRPGFVTEAEMRTLLEYQVGEAARGKAPAQFMDFSLLEEVYQELGRR
jgi:NitT/TauT family transport system substrate-binding protein